MKKETVAKFFADAADVKTLGNDSATDYAMDEGFTVNRLVQRFKKSLRQINN